MTQAQQISLYDAQTISLPHNGTPTSIAGALAARERGPTQKEMILAYVAQVGNATQAEIEEALGMLRSSVAGRVNALALEGKLIKTTRTRPGAYGVPNAVYTLPLAASESVEEAALANGDL